jgi:hypothetical protein
LTGSTAQYWVTGDVVFNSLTTGVAAFTGNNLDSVALGTTQISASRGSVLSDSVLVEVVDAIPTGIDCRPTYVQTTPDDTVNFVIVASYTAGDPVVVTNELDSFTSSDEDVAAFLPVDPAGVLTAISLGTSVLEATWTDAITGLTFSDTCEVDVVGQVMLPETCEDADMISAEDQILYGNTEYANDDLDGDSYQDGDVFYIVQLDNPTSIDVTALLLFPAGWDYTVTAYPLAYGSCDGVGGAIPLSSSSPCLNAGTYMLVVDGNENPGSGADNGTFELDLDFESCVYSPS